jgi:NADH:ubiquinone oxidoreductase subunit D
VGTIAQEGLIINIMERYLHSYVNDYYSSTRTLFYELSRITNHLLAVTTHGIDIGSLNSMLLAFEEREKIANLHEYASGSRIHSSLLYLHGLRWDIPLRFIITAHDLLSTFPFLCKELHSILSHSAIFIIRLFDVGKLDRDTCIRSSVSGIIIRSVGEIIDARIFGHCVYNSTTFTIAIGWRGDCLDRYYIRMNELQQSAAMINDILLTIPFLIHISSLHHILPHFVNNINNNNNNHEELNQNIQYKKSNISTSPSSNIHKSMSYFHIHYLTAHSFYYGIRIFMECPKGIQSIFIHHQPSSSYFTNDEISSPRHRDSRIDLANNDFLTIANIHKYIHSLFLFDFIALIGSLDFVLGSIDCHHHHPNGANSI